MGQRALGARPAWLRRVPVERIDWIAAEGDYSRVHVGTDAFLCDYPLVRLGAMLDPARFLRAHRSALVRLGAVAEVRRGPSGQLHLITGATAPAPVGRRARPAVRRALGKDPTPP